jgi:uncharacterized membrane protein
MKPKYWPLIVILIAGTLLRFYHNLDISLWHDEAFSALLIKYPFSEMMYRIGLDVHPPAYYLFLRAWHYILGDSLLSLRGFSILFGTASIWAVWLLAKEAFKNEKAALWAAILAAINPFQLQYVTEARMYTMGAFFVVLAAYFLVKALNQQKQLHEQESLHMPNLPQEHPPFIPPFARGGIMGRLLLWYYLGFTVSMIIIIYTHYYLFFTAAALGFYGLLFLFFHHRWNFKKYLWLLLSFVIIGLSFLPWLKTFFDQYRQVGQSYWIPPMDKWSIPSTFWDMLLGIGRDTTKTSTQFWLVAVSLFSLYLFYWFLKKTQSFHKWLVALAVLAPFLGSLLFLVLARLKGSQTSLYLDRYFLFASMFYTVMLAVWLKEVRLRWLSVSLFIVYVLVNLLAFGHYWTALDVKSKPGMAAAAKYLNANVEPGQKIYGGSSFMFFNLKYYIGQLGIANQPLLYSGGTTQVSQLPHYAGTALLTDADLLPDFSRDVKNSDTVWLIWTNGFGANKPEVPKNWTQIYEQSFAEVRPYVGTNVYVTEYKVN